MKTAVKKKKKMTKENWTGLAFIAPAVILLFVFLFIPFMLTVGYSFTNYNILKPDKMELNKIAARWPAKAVAQFLLYNKKSSGSQVLKVVLLNHHKITIKQDRHHHCHE